MAGHLVFPQYFTYPCFPLMCLISLDPCFIKYSSIFTFKMGCDYSRDVRVKPTDHQRTQSGQSNKSNKEPRANSVHMKVDRHKVDPTDSTPACTRNRVSAVSLTVYTSNYVNDQCIKGIRNGSFYLNVMAVS